MVIVTAASSFPFTFGEEYCLCRTKAQRIMSRGYSLIFKAISREEFERLSVDQRIVYLNRLMADLRQKLEETREQAERMKGKLP